MAQDFYKKVQELSENYQRRELDCLNAERKWSCALNKSNYSLPVQDFYQKLDRREKEAVLAHQNIVKELKNLEKHISSLSLKLKRLRMFENISRTNEAANRSSLPISVPLSVVSENSYTSNFHEKLNLKTISTQTDIGIHCEKCCPKNRLPNLITENVSNLSTDPLQTEMFHISHVTEHPTIPLPETTQSILETGTGNFTNHTHPTLTAPLMSNVNGIIGESESVNQQRNSSDFLGQKSCEKEDTLVNAPSLSFKVQPDTIFSKESVAHNGNPHQSTVTDGKFKEMGENAEVEDKVQLLKSDKKHKSNEFDFLESETPNISDDTQSQDNSNALLSPGKTSRIKRTRDKSFNVSYKDKSDSSGSVNEPSSAPENALPGYNSDSFSEKESPLKASAAYQALLGNTAPRKSNQKTSDSDTEDEVEKALANTVSKNSKQLLTSKIQNKKEEKLAPHADLKSPVKSTKSGKSAKPQLKLSNNTRKVLGLDTSSGSEVELYVETSKGKIEEDSDEFDFFD